MLRKQLGGRHCANGEWPIALTQYPVPVLCVAFLRFILRSTNEFVGRPLEAVGGMAGYVKDSKASRCDARIDVGTLGRFVGCVQEEEMLRWMGSPGEKKRGKIPKSNQWRPGKER